MDWNKIGSGAIGAGIDYGFGWLSSLFGNAAAARQAELNRNFQREERLATQEWNLEQWNRENEYNTPKNQLQRMLDAGINPNSGMNNISNVAPGSVRTSPMSGSQASTFAGPESQIGQQGVGKYWENKLLEQQIFKTNQEGLGQQITNEWKPLHEANANLEEKGRIALQERSQQYLEKQIEELGIKIKLDQLTLDFTPEQFNFQRAMFIQELAKIGAEIDNLYKQGDVLVEQKETEKKKQGLIGVQTAREGVALSVDRVKAHFFETYGISCDDATASIYAKAVELKAQGKEAEANKMLEDWFKNLADYRDATTMPDLEKFMVDLLSPYKDTLGNLVGNNLLPILQILQGINPWQMPKPFSFYNQTYGGQGIPEWHTRNPPLKK